MAIRWTMLALALATICGGAPGADAALAKSAVPLPMPRPPVATPSKPDDMKPDDLRLRGSAPDRAGPTSTDSETFVRPSPPEPSACLRALTANIAIVRPLPPIVGAGGCGGDDIVELESVVIAGGPRIRIEPAATMRCRLATAFAEWVRGELAPAGAKSGAPLVRIDNFDSYSCRGRNRVLGAKLSEHGKANAIDIRAIARADGTVLRPTDPNVGRGFREAMRTSACQRFTTVLGPGSDGYHEDHIHVDLAERRSGYRLCRWELRDPPPAPPPTPAPDVAAAPKGEEAPDPAPVRTAARASVPLPLPRPSAAPRR